jgi:N-acetylglutamate synthase-like GNAT family acetyltransferase
VSSALECRPLDHQDLESAGRLLVESYPHRAHEPAYWQRSPEREHMQRWGIFDHPDHLVAYAALWRVDGQKFRFDVIVSPPQRRRGHGDRLFELVNHEAENAGAETLQARAYGVATDSLTFLARRQFVETMRMRGFARSLAGIDVSSLTAASRSCLTPDVSIEMASPSQYKNEPLWDKLAELHDAAREGWPDPDPGGPMAATDPAMLWRMLMPSKESVIAFMIASQRDQFVGYSVLSRRRDTGEAQFASTAVRPSMRDRHVATALRARCMIRARDAGFLTVRSASGNPALIRINERFGFHGTYTEVRLVRRLR